MNMEIKKEKSCGGVVFYKSNGSFLFLIEHMQKGHYSIPKGHIEQGETNLECALREIKEETNLDVVLVGNFEKVITYSPKKCVMKDVIFYLFETKTMEVKPQLEEVQDIQFLSFDEAYLLLTHETDKNVLLEARQFLESYKL